MRVENLNLIVTMFGQVLQRVFTSSILLLATFWECHKLSPEAEQQDDTASSEAGENLAAWILDQLALLQFCRSRMNAYSDLLAEVYTWAARSKKVCLYHKSVKLYTGLFCLLSGICTIHQRRGSLWFIKH